MRIYIVFSGSSSPLLVKKNKALVNNFGQYTTLNSKFTETYSSAILISRDLEEIR